MRVAVAGGTGTVGRYVVERAGAVGHDVVILSRSTGVDLVDGTGLGDALVDGVEAIVDVTDAGETEREAATAFFTAVAGSLQRVGSQRGVQHIVTLSIVGIDRATGFGYYTAKLEQERVALAGPVPGTILRATQFHELPPRMLAARRENGVARFPRRRVQTVAARTVAAVLVELVEGPPRGQAGELAGPEASDLVTLARAFAERRGLEVEIVDEDDPAVPDGALLPGPGARLEGPSFGEWLWSEDALRV
jgi:uncharacterized protein YbjT (DUF2867 family)